MPHKFKFFQIHEKYFSKKFHPKKYSSKYFKNKKELLS